jgi:hypothetical protein
MVKRGRHPFGRQIYWACVDVNGEDKHSWAGSSGGLKQCDGLLHFFCKHKLGSSGQNQQYESKTEKWDR